MASVSEMTVLNIAIARFGAEACLVDEWIVDEERFGPARMSRQFEVWIDGRRVGGFVDTDEGADTEGVMFGGWVHDEWASHSIQRQVHAWIDGVEVPAIDAEWAAMGGDD